MNKTPDYIIDRAVELWCRKLHNPVFDNGDNSEQGFFGMALATMVIHGDKDKMPDAIAQIEKFRESLAATLKHNRDNDEYFPRWLDVDYGPCKLLGDAADEAGIPCSQFSCKSVVSMSDDHVSTSFGYGAESIHHYLLSDGSWLITSLSGSEIDKIKKSVLNGNPMDLSVEKPA